MGQVVTFYSFKGGVGRTMTLANIAVLLARWGKKVLVVDWDLEAPGLEYYFKDFIDPLTVAQQNGVLDILYKSFNSHVLDIKNWQSYVSSIPLPECAGKLDLINSGKQTNDYFGRLRSLDVNSLYSEYGGGSVIEEVRNWWKDNYDYILLDSRTGITDIGGICTIQLPDILALLFTTTEQSLGGAIEVAKKVGEQRQRLPFDRLNLNCLPVPSRFDTLTEHLVSQEWLSRFASSLETIYKDWLPIDVDVRKFLEATKVPYVSYFSFGEKLAVLEQGTSDPASLGYAYESLAALIGNDLANADDLLKSRDRFVRSVERRLELVTEFVPSPELAFLFVEIARAESLGTLVTRVEEDTTPEALEQRLFTVAREFDGDLTSKTGASYVFRFTSATNAVRSGTKMQEELMLRPFRAGDGIVRARMGLHGMQGWENELPTILRQLVRTAAALTRNARVNQLIASAWIQKKCAKTIKDVRFTRVGQIELDEPFDDEAFIDTFVVVAIKRVRLNGKELDLLFSQDPSSRSAGGFQAFLVRLQSKTNRQTGELDLTIPDRERIARLAFDYRQGGWQNRLRKIFGRVLGPDLGRSN